MPRMARSGSHVAVEGMEAVPSVGGRIVKAGEGTASVISKSKLSVR